MIPMASDNTGKITPKKQTKKTLKNSKLFSRKRASRENIEVISEFDFRSFQRWLNSKSDVIRVNPIKPKNNGPMALWAKAWTDSSTPDRVRKVPKITRS